ncbi:flagellar protein FlaG [Leptolinea tardivitalis]|uniref:Uncharacterized protein n=1 Tax=Leptolinea tardivitalis TaxID=229920 RepID=A0A0P6X7I0_9CHLR|nr:flagellar protein FlaG [Leptolinea tardivitalis]KPL71092.1 hypothetical protein ADM99_12535 [Leptolinea tardivitalis]GAP22518.1 FlaG protein [Leptolinea tardivitalis]
MSEFFVYSVGKSRQQPPAQVEPRHTSAEPSEPKSPVPMYTFPGNTRLVFKVDETKHEVVVMIIDEASSKVIRTVPLDASQESQSGGLIQKDA